MLLEHFVHSSRETRRVHEVLEEGWWRLNIARQSHAVKPLAVKGDPSFACLIMRVAVAGRPDFHPAFDRVGEALLDPLFQFGPTHGWMVASKDKNLK